MKQSTSNAIARFSVCKVAYAALLTIIRDPEENEDRGCDFGDWPAALPGLNKARGAYERKNPDNGIFNNFVARLAARFETKRNEEIERVGEIDAY